MALPTPPLAPWTSTLSPGRNLAASVQQEERGRQHERAAAATGEPDPVRAAGTANSARVRATSARAPPGV